jgi:hypothetical protein
MNPTGMPYPMGGGAAPMAPNPTVSGGPMRPASAPVPPAAPQAIGPGPSPYGGNPGAVGGGAAQEPTPGGPMMPAGGGAAPTPSPWGAAAPPRAPGAVAQAGRPIYSGIGAPPIARPQPPGGPMPYPGTGPASRPMMPARKPSYTA